MSNHEIAQLLRQVAVSYVIKDEKKYRFQIIAYQRAADAIESAVTEITDLYKEKKLDTIPGVGTSIQQSLSELCETGKVKHFQTLLESIPSAMFPLMDIPSFGPKKAYRLVLHFHLTDEKTVIKDVKEAS